MASRLTGVLEAIWVAGALPLPERRRLCHCAVGQALADQPEAAPAKAEPCRDLEAVLSGIGRAAGLDAAPSATQAKHLLRERGERGQSHARRLGRASRTRNDVAHPDVTLLDDVVREFGGVGATPSEESTTAEAGECEASESGSDYAKQDSLKPDIVILPTHKDSKGLDKNNVPHFSDVTAYTKNTFLVQARGFDTEVRATNIPKKETDGKQVSCDAPATAAGHLEGAELLHFHTSKSGGERIVLGDYVDRNKGQNVIYFATREHFLEADAETLMLREGQEMLWVSSGAEELAIQQLQEFDGRELKPLTKRGLGFEGGGYELGGIGTEQEAGARERLPQRRPGKRSKGLCKGQ